MGDHRTLDEFFRSDSDESADRPSGAEDDVSEAGDDAGSEAGDDAGSEAEDTAVSEAEDDAGSEAEDTAVSEAGDAAGSGVDAVSDTQTRTELVDAERTELAPTYQWTPDGAPCAVCGATVERRWREEDGFVCTDCKDW